MPKQSSINAAKRPHRRGIIYGAILAAITFFATHTGWSSDWDLPNRKGPRPLTTNGVPHIQLDVEVMPRLRETLIRRVATIPGVEIRDTIISLPGARGFWLDEDLSLERPDVIVGGREFAHVHPDGSLHISLPDGVAQSAVAAGWAVKHPWADKRPGWSGFVMLYASRSAEEVDTVLQLILTSYNFVTGKNLAISSL